MDKLACGTLISRRGFVRDEQRQIPSPEILCAAAADLKGKPQETRSVPCDRR